MQHSAQALCSEDLPCLSAIADDHRYLMNGKDPTTIQMITSLISFLSALSQLHSPGTGQAHHPTSAPHHLSPFLIFKLEKMSSWWNPAITDDSTRKMPIARLVHRRYSVDCHCFTKWRMMLRKENKGQGHKRKPDVRPVQKYPIAKSCFFRTSERRDM